jgi:hypothetical protein
MSGLIETLMSIPLYLTVEAVVKVFFLNKK